MLMNQGGEPFLFFFFFFFFLLSFLLLLLFFFSFSSFPGREKGGLGLSQVLCFHSTRFLFLLYSVEVSGCGVVVGSSSPYLSCLFQDVKGGGGARIVASVLLPFDEISVSLAFLSKDQTACLRACGVIVVRGKKGFKAAGVFLVVRAHALYVQVCISTPDARLGGFEVKHIGDSILCVDYGIEEVNPVFGVKPLSCFHLRKQCRRGIVYENSPLTTRPQHLAAGRVWCFFPPNPPVNICSLTSLCQTSA